MAERVSSPSPVNLAFGTRTSLNELIEVVEGVLERRLERETLPARRGDVPHSQADGTRLAGLFPGLDPVALEDGVRATVDWFEQVAASSGS